MDGKKLFARNLLNRPSTPPGDSSVLGRRAAIIHEDDLLHAAVVRGTEPQTPPSAGGPGFAHDFSQIPVRGEPVSDPFPQGFERWGAAERARFMNGMQRQVGNQAVSRMMQQHRAHQAHQATTATQPPVAAPEQSMWQRDLRELQTMAPQDGVLSGVLRGVPYPGELVLLNARKGTREHFRPQGPSASGDVSFELKDVSAGDSLRALVSAGPGNAFVSDWTVPAPRTPRRQPESSAPPQSGTILAEKIIRLPTQNEKSASPVVPSVADHDVAPTSWRRHSWVRGAADLKRVTFEDGRLRGRIEDVPRDGVVVLTNHTRGETRTFEPHGEIVNVDLEGVAPGDLLTLSIYEDFNAYTVSARLNGSLLKEGTSDVMRTTWVAGAADASVGANAAEVASDRSAPSGGNTARSPLGTLIAHLTNRNERISRQAPSVSTTPPLPPARPDGAAVDQPAATLAEPMVEVEEPVVELAVVAAAAPLLAKRPAPTPQRSVIRDVQRPYQAVASETAAAVEDNNCVINLPTGSGKTIVGCARIEDWLTHMSEGESVVITVPTNAVARQWRETLCFKAVGLGLPADSVFAGSPADLERYARENPGRPRPSIIVLTSQGLSSVASGANRDLTPFFKAWGVTRALIDEVHLGIADHDGPYGTLIHQMTDMRTQGALKGLVAFSATTDDVKKSLDRLNLKLVLNVPADSLIETGFIPSYRAAGVVSTLSEDEQAIQGSLVELKDAMRSILRLIDANKLAEAFREIATSDNAGLVRSFADGQRKYPNTRGEKQLQVIRERIVNLSDPDAKIGLTQMDMLLAIQLYSGLSDDDLVAGFLAPGRSLADWATLRDTTQTLRDKLASLVHTTKHAPLFESIFGDVPVILAPDASAAEVTRELGKARAGIISSMSTYWRAFGEGMNDAIVTIHREEAIARKAIGSDAQPLCSLVFVNAQRVDIPKDLHTPVDATPGGLVGQVLETTLNSRGKIRALGVGSNQAIIPEGPGQNLRRELLTHLRDVRVGSMLSQSIQDEVIGELSASLKAQPGFSDAAVRSYIEKLLLSYADKVFSLSSHVNTVRFSEWIKHMTADAAGQRSGLPPQTLKAIHAIFQKAESNSLRGYVTELFDWASVARHIQDAPVCIGKTVGGDTAPFAVVNYASSKLSQMMRELFSRAVDDAKVGIDMMFLTDGSAVGADMLRPGVEIVTKPVSNLSGTKQRMGRLLRAPAHWTVGHADLLTKLVGTRGIARECFSNLDDATVARLMAKCPPRRPAPDQLTPAELEILRESYAAVFPKAPRPTVFADGRLAGATHEERQQLATALLVHLNKPATMYELHEVRPGRTSSEVTLSADKKTIQRRPEAEAKFDGIRFAGGPGAAHVPLMNPSVDTTAAALGLQLRAVLPGAMLNDVAAWVSDVAFA